MGKEMRILNSSESSCHFLIKKKFDGSFEVSNRFSVDFKGIKKVLNPNNDTSIFLD